MKKIMKFMFIPIVILAVVLLITGTYTVPTSSYAVITRFSKISKIISEPGLYIKVPFADSVRKISKKTQLFDVAPSDVITKDKKSMVADDYILWRVTDPVLYMKTLSGFKSSAEDRVSVSVYNATKNIISSMTQDEVIEARGEKLTELITNEANSDIGGYGIEITEAAVKALDLPEDNKASVYQRMISERENIAAGYTAQGDAQAQKIRNQTDKDVAVIKADAEKKAAATEAEGESEYMKTLSEAYNTQEKADFYAYTRSLESLKNSLKGSGEKTLILDKDSEFAKILYGQE